jgi:hypothetical protein
MIVGGYDGKKATPCFELTGEVNSKNWMKM